MQETASFTHCVVMDPDGHKVGTVRDVVPDAMTLEPRWLVVDTGLLKAAHYVPVSGAVRSGDSEIVVPFSKDIVQQSVKAHGDHVLSTTDDSQLIDYYGLN